MFFCINSYMHMPPLQIDRPLLLLCSSTCEQGYLERNGIKSQATAVALPPLICSTLVQLVNQPIIRASITLQVRACAFEKSAVSCIKNFTMQW
jgi:hypothetical protein